jgi:prepilin-type N-terminal cleavage/methylation domain-containing protein
MINTEYVMKKVLAQGFTLVELLIVIALLGVIATIVIAAINPIEQANRASDAGMKADASQVVSALQRYYVSHGGYPWNDSACPAAGTCDNGPNTSASDAYAFLPATDPGVGVCGVVSPGCKAASAANQGLLITALELQSAFVNKSWIDVSTPSMWVGKALGSSASVFVCWAPKSQSNRQNLLNSVTSGNKLFTVAGAFTGTGLPAAGDSTHCAIGGSHWTDGTCVECEPE